MLELFDYLSQDALGITVLVLVGVILLLFLAWFVPFAVVLPHGPIVSAVKSVTRSRRMPEEERPPTRTRSWTLARPSDRKQDWAHPTTHEEKVGAHLSQGSTG